MIERFFVGPDAHIGPLDGSFRREFRRLRAASDFARGGKVTKTPPGDAADGHFVPIGPLTPRSPITGVTPLAWRWIFGAQNLSGLLPFNPGHWALGVQKFRTNAVPQPRLALPNQRSWSVSGRRGDPCGRPEAFPFRGRCHAERDG